MGYTHAICYFASFTFTLVHLSSTHTLNWDETYFLFITPVELALIYNLGLTAVGDSAPSNLLQTRQIRTIGLQEAMHISELLNPLAYHTPIDTSYTNGAVRLTADRHIEFMS